MKLVVYTRHCLACRDKHNWKRLKQFAQKHKLPLSEKRVRPDEQHEIELPYVSLGRNAISLHEDLERLL